MAEPTEVDTRNIGVFGSRVVALFAAVWFLGTSAGGQEPCSGSGEQLCLGGRFSVTVEWQEPTGQRGQGAAIQLQAEHSGLFSFFDSENWELLVKVLDGCAVNGRYWVLSAAATDLPFQLRVHDSFTGAVQTYDNPGGLSVGPLIDTDAFSTCSAAGDIGPRTGSVPSSAVREVSLQVGRSEAAVESPVVSRRTDLGLCVPSDTKLCLGRGRFEVELGWQATDGLAGLAQTAPLRSDSSGLFWFFDSDNTEALVKVLDGCSVNQRFWVFAAAATDVGLELRVTDTLTGLSRSYANPTGTPAPGVSDTNAFASCSLEGNPEPAIEFDTDRSILLAGRGDTAQVSVRVFDTAGLEVVSPELTWTAFPEGIVSINPSRRGRATVRALTDSPQSVAIRVGFEGVEATVNASIVRLAKNAILVEHEWLTSVSSSSVSLMTNMTTDQIAAGSILVSEETSGVLGRVVSQRLDGETLIVDLAPASLVDAFEDLFVDTVSPEVEIAGGVGIGGSEAELLCSDENGVAIDVAIDGMFTFTQTLRARARTRIQSSRLVEFSLAQDVLDQQLVSNAQLSFPSGPPATIECRVQTPPVRLVAGVHGPMVFELRARPTFGFDVGLASGDGTRQQGLPSGSLRGGSTAGLRYTPSAGWHPLTPDVSWLDESLGQTVGLVGDDPFATTSASESSVDSQLVVFLGRLPNGEATLESDFAAQVGRASVELELLHPADPGLAAYRGPRWELSTRARGSLSSDISSPEFAAFAERVGVPEPFRGPLPLFDQTLTVGRSPAPRMTVTRVVPSTQPIEVGDVLTLTMTSPSSSVPTSLSFWAAKDGSPTLTEIASAPAGSLEVMWTPLEQGSYDIFLRLEVANDELSSAKPYASHPGVSVRVERSTKANLSARLDQPGSAAAGGPQPVVLTAGDEVTISGEICNRGTQPSGSFQWTLELNGNLIESQFPADLLPQAFGFPCIAVSWNGVLAAGNYTADLFADPLEEVTESREDDNRSSLDFEVLPAPAPDLEPRIVDTVGAVTTSISFTLDEPFVARVLVTNEGGAMAPATFLTLYLSIDTVASPSEQVGRAMVRALPAGDEVLASLQVTVASSTPVPQWLLACTDPVQGETLLANNCAIASLVDVGSRRP